MHCRHLGAAIILVISACTYTPQGGGVDAEFHPPFVDHYWQVEHYTLQSGAKACAISSGYNGLTVYLRHFPEGENVSIKSNRRMEPGATLTVNVGNGNFEAYDTYFPPGSARKLVEYFAKGGKAYLEWSELSGPSGAANRVHVQNIVRLDDFGAQLKECRDALHL